MCSRLRAARAASGIDRINFTVAETPRAAARTPRHACYPWEGS
jgi:hypothetical protein